MSNSKRVATGEQLGVHHIGHTRYCIDEALSLSRVMLYYQAYLPLVREWHSRRPRLPQQHTMLRMQKCSDINSLDTVLSEHDGKFNYRRQWPPPVIRPASAIVAMTAK
jgi:hypothetical protein